MKLDWLNAFVASMLIMVVIITCGVVVAESRSVVPTYEQVGGRVVGSWNGHVYASVDEYGLMKFESETDFKANQKLQVMLEDQEIVAVLWDE